MAGACRDIARTGALTVLLLLLLPAGASAATPSGLLGQTVASVNEVVQSTGATVDQVTTQVDGVVAGTVEGTSRPSRRGPGEPGRQRAGPGHRARRRRSPDARQHRHRGGRRNRLGPLGRRRAGPGWPRAAARPGASRRIGRAPVRRARGSRPGPVGRRLDRLRR